MHVVTVAPCVTVMQCVLLNNAHPQSLLNTPETKVTTLSNGLRVASENSGGSTCTVSELEIIRAVPYARLV